MYFRGSHLDVLNCPECYHLKGFLRNSYILLISWIKCAYWEKSHLVHLGCLWFLAFVFTHWLAFYFYKISAVQLEHHALHGLPTLQLIFVHVLESLVVVPVSTQANWFTPVNIFYLNCFYHLCLFFFFFIYIICAISWL